MSDTPMTRSVWVSLDLRDGTIPAVPGGPTDHHVTVVYVGRNLTDEAYGNVCDRARGAAARVAGPLVGTVAGVDVFEPSAGSKGKTPAFAPVVLPGVETLRAALVDPLPAPVPPTTVAFTHLTVHRGPEIVSFPLG
jgi:hypothetical protein